MLLGYYSLHFIIPSLPPFSFFSILLVHIYFMKKESLFWTSLLKTLHKFYNCIRKGFFKVTILNQVITMQIMNFYFIGDGQGKNSLLTKHHFILLKLTRKVVFQGGCGVTFSNFYRGERLFTVYRCMTFCGSIIEL